jgi:hypothetical protein
MSHLPILSLIVSSLCVMAGERGWSQLQRRGHERGFLSECSFFYEKSKIAKTTFIIFAALGIWVPEKPKQSISSIPSLDILFLNVYVIGFNINIYGG